MIVSVFSGACGPRACVRGDSSSSVVFSASASLTPRKSMSPKILLVLSLLCITVYSAPPRRTAATVASQRSAPGKARAEDSKERTGLQINKQLVEQIL